MRMWTLAEEETRTMGDAQNERGRKIQNGGS